MKYLAVTFFASLILTATPHVTGFESFVSDIRSNNIFCSFHVPDWDMLRLFAQRMEEHMERKEDYA